MRKLLPILSLLCCCLVGCSGLAQPPEEPTQLKEPTQLNVYSNKELVANASGYRSVEIQFFANKAWTISGGNEWCSLAKTQGDAGSQSITISLSDNTTHEERKATLTVQCGELSEQVQITQKPNNTIVVGKSKYEIALEGETIEVEVQSNASVSVSVHEPWITMVAGKGLTTNKYQFKIAPNDTPKSREARIGFYGSSSDGGGSVSEYVTITQPGAETLTTNAQSPYEFDAQGGDLAFDVKTNLPSFTAEVSAAWIYVDHNSYYPYRQFTVKANESPVARTGTITIKAGVKTETIAINQKGLFKKLVKQMVATNSNGTQTTDFAYDNQGRLIQKGTTTYEYKTGEIYEYGQDKHKYLVENGRITSVVLNFLGASAKTLSYEYAAAKLSKIGVDSYYGSNDDKTYTWSGDNMVKMTEKAGVTYSFTYSISSNYINYDFSGVMNPTLGFVGLPSSNLIENYTVGNKTYSYTYQLDGDGCPTTVTEVMTESGASPQTTTYTITY